MHFTTLFILKGEKPEDLSVSEIEDIFGDRFCYSCGATTPKYEYWCDWFQIGGRWCDILKARKGIHCERSWSNDNAPIEEGMYSIVNIEDLEEDIPEHMIYAVATKSRIYQKSNDWGGSEEGVDKDKFTKLIRDINAKKFNGVIALIDCHD